MAQDHNPPRSPAAEAPSAKNNVVQPLSNAELLELQRKKRKKRKTRILIIVLVIAALVITGIGILISIAIKKINGLMNESMTNVTTATVETGSFGTTVKGDGILASVDVENVDLTNKLSILEVYVNEGDMVEEGDLIATVTNSSLMTAISSAQDQIDELDQKIADAKDDKVDEKVKTPLAGRIKAIYGSVNDDVSQVMYDNGALILISLDGYLAVDVESDSLKAGDSVVVIASNGTEYTATVEKNINGTATVLVSDKETVLGDTVTVKNGGSTVGEGELYIHSRLAITGYAGTIKSVKVSVNQYVKAGDTLLLLKNLTTPADYDALLQQREKLEEDLNELLKIYKDGGIRATISGVIDMVYDPDMSSDDSDNSDYSDYYGGYDDIYGGYYDMDDNNQSSGNDDSVPEGMIRVAQISPNTEMIVTITVKESDVLKLEVGQVAEVTINSLGYTCEGVVDKINTKSTSSASQAGMSGYQVDIKFEMTPDMLPGMSAEVVINIDGVTDVLMIPVDALHQTSSSSFVYTSYDNETNTYGGMVEVQAGLVGDEYAEIISGLSEGDVVYYEPVERWEDDYYYEDEYYEEEYEDVSIDEYMEMAESAEAEAEG